MQNKIKELSGQKPNQSTGSKKTNYRTADEYRTTEKKKVQFKEIANIANEIFCEKCLTMP